MRQTARAGVAAQRAIDILEIVARAGRAVAGKEIIDALQLPKPTVYRVCALLEAMGMIQRAPDSKKFVVGQRLCALGLEAMANAPSRGPIRAVLQALMEQVGETCTFTVLDGHEAVCVERVESQAPLRLHLQAGSRIPLHCTASGKLFLALMPRTLARRLLHGAPLRRYTPGTVIDPAQIEQQLAHIRKERISWDDQGYWPGLVALAVAVSSPSGRIRGTVSVNAPAARMSYEQACRHLPALRDAAHAIARHLFDETDESRGDDPDEAADEAAGAGA